MVVSNGQMTTTERAILVARRQLSYLPRPMNPHDVCEVMLDVMREVPCRARIATLAVNDVLGELTEAEQEDPIGDPGFICPNCGRENASGRLIVEGEDARHVYRLCRRCSK